MPFPKTASVFRHYSLKILRHFVLRIFQRILISLAVCWKVDDYLSLINCLFSEQMLQWTVSSLREKCLNTRIFLARIFLHSDWIRILLRKSSYSVKIQENTDLIQKWKQSLWTLKIIRQVNLRIQFQYRKIGTKNNSVFGRFSRSAWYKENYIFLSLY